MNSALSSTVEAWLPARARLSPSAEALRFAADGDAGGEGRLDYADLAREADSVALRLLSLGIGRGDRIAVNIGTCPRLVALVHAAQRIGAVLVPLSTRLSRPELERVLAHADARLLLVDDAGPSPGPAPAVAPAARCLHAHRDLDRVSVAKSASLPSRIDPDDAWMIVYTSGTTSLPKGVVLTNANHAAAAAASRQRLGHGAGDVWLATLPLHHVGGLSILARAVLDGSRVDLEDGFDASRVAEEIRHGEATMISVVPTMLSRVLDLLGDAGPSPRAAALRCVLVGGAALSPTLARRALSAGLPIAATYGLTEACSQVCTGIPGSADAADGLVGRPLPGIDVSIDSPGSDGVGELLLRGANVTRGYFRNAEADRAAFGTSLGSGSGNDGDAGRWLRSGDLASIDGQGRVRIACRRNDLIISGGENVTPAEVESVLETHPAVAECAVFGLDDEEWGQRIVALVVFRGESRVRPAVADSSDVGDVGADLNRLCRARLAAFKIPKSYRFASSLPRNAMGKLDRRLLAEAWAAAENNPVPRAG